jgi:hypothetical protein
MSYQAYISSLLCSSTYDKFFSVLVSDIGLLTSLSLSFIHYYTFLKIVR